MESSFDTLHTVAIIVVIFNICYIVISNRSSTRDYKNEKVSAKVYYKAVHSDGSSARDKKLIYKKDTIVTDKFPLDKSVYCGHGLYFCDAEFAKEWATGLGYTHYILVKPVGDYRTLYGKYNAEKLLILSHSKPIDELRVDNNIIKFDGFWREVYKTNNFDRSTIMNMLTSQNHRIGILLHIKNAMNRREVFDRKEFKELLKIMKEGNHTDLEFALKGTVFSNSKLHGRYTKSQIKKYLRRF